MEGKGNYRFITVSAHRTRSSQESIAIAQQLSEECAKESVFSDGLKICQTHVK